MADSDIGDPRGRPVIYLHGTPASRLEINHATYLEAFTKAGLRVIGVDRPGIGDSSPPTQPGHTPFIADSEARLEHLNILDAIAIGHSRGGLLALAVLIPQRIKAVGLFGSTGLPDDPELLRNLTPTSGLMLRLVKRMSNVIKSIADAEQLRLVGRNWHQSLQYGMRRDPGWSMTGGAGWSIARVQIR